MNSMQHMLRAAACALRADSLYNKLTPEQRAAYDRVKLPMEGVSFGKLPEPAYTENIPAELVPLLRQPLRGAMGAALHLAASLLGAEEVPSLWVKIEAVDGGVLVSIVSSSELTPEE